MTGRGRLVHLLLFLSALVALGYSVNGSLIPPSGDSSIWYHSGLLVLILGVFLVEPYFTKPADAAINGLVVFVSTSTLSEPPHSSWWTLLRLLGFACSVTAFLVLWAGSPAISGNDTSRLKRIAYLTVIRIGSASVLYSAVFLLAMLSYFDAQSPTTRVMLVFWALLLGIKQLDLEGLLRSLTSTLRAANRNPIGRLTRFSEPNIVRFALTGGQDCPTRALIAFTRDGIVDDESQLGLVVAHRSAPGLVEAEALLIDSPLGGSALDGRPVAVRVKASDSIVEKRLSASQLGRSIHAIVGFAARSSSIARLSVEIWPGATLEEGSLLSVLPADGKAVMYQVTDATLSEEVSIEAGERAYTTCAAQQLGRWDSTQGGFRTYSWVAPEHGAVILAQDLAPDEFAIPEGLLRIGGLPNSTYPVCVDIADLVLCHSAILGVTGSGKSFLAFSLIEACAASGIKVLCLDVTGDYQRYLTSGVRLASTAAVDAFLTDPANRIGVVEFTDQGQHPIVAAHTVAKKALDWCRANRADDEVSNPVPKVLLVMEEAHSLVPEWNFNPVKDFQEKVNATAQIVLQARKFGLGFMVVTQRTANVTKSILNQCNTIIAFQAHDETGFDFMRNYMGSHYVDAIPNLKARHGVVVGTASRSERPIIVRFDDQQREARPAQLPVFPPPNLAEAAADVRLPPDLGGGGP